MAVSNNKSLALLSIKLLHTFIWAIMVTAIFFVVYAGIFDIMNIYVIVSIGLVLLECMVLLIFKWRCPLTLIGHKYTDNHEVGFDIFLPKIVAKHNKTIFSLIFSVGLILVILNLLNLR